MHDVILHMTPHPFGRYLNWRTPHPFNDRSLHFSLRSLQNVDLFLLSTPHGLHLDCPPCATLHLSTMNLWQPINFCTCQDQHQDGQPAILCLHAAFATLLPSCAAARLDHLTCLQRTDRDVPLIKGTILHNTHSVLQLEDFFGQYLSPKLIL
jgi:hypothetical protein